MGKGIALAERMKSKELTTFACLVDDEFIRVQAEDPHDADEKTNLGSMLIIQGSAEDIGAKRVEEVSGPYFGELEDEPGLKEGVPCTIEVEDPVRVVNAIYCGEDKMNGYGFLAFVKRGTKFWACSASTRFNSIDGKRL